MSPVQILLALLFAAACTYTVVGYPQRYGALSGRSRLFRSAGLFLLDLLLGLVLLGTLVDFRDVERPRIALLRAGAYVLACVFLLFSLLCVALLDWLETLVAYRRAQRDILYRMRDEAPIRIPPAEKNDGDTDSDAR